MTALKYDWDMANAPQRFLVVRLSSIGDIVHALPAVAALGRAYPRAEIHWAIETRHADLLEGNPYIHRVIRLDLHAWRRKILAPETVEEFLRGIAEIRKATYDAAVDFQGLYKSALIAWLSGAQERIGFAENWLREPAAGVLYTQRVTPRDRRHVIEMNVGLVERLGAPRFPPSSWQFPLPRNQADDRYVDQQLAARKVEEFIVINPGGGWKAKCWPPQNYAALVRRLESERASKLILTGSSAEEELIRGILEHAGSSRACYIPTTVVQLIALARRAKLFIGGDTGPVHLAAAAGIPVVAIFTAQDSLNTPERNGPFSAADVVVSNRRSVDPTQQNESSRYLEGVSVDAVIAGVRERWTRAYG